MSSATRVHHRRWTLANGLTAFRLLIAAPALVILALAGWREGFLWLLVASFTSDFLDGTVARLTGGITGFGARLDSWADGAAYCAIAIGVALLWPRLVAREWPAMLSIIASFMLPGALGYLKFRRFTSYHTLLVKAAVGGTAVALLLALWGGPVWPRRAAAVLAVAACVALMSIAAQPWRPDPSRFRLTAFADEDYVETSPVWEFIRSQPGLRTDGHNIFLYHHPTQPGAPILCDFGVEVTRTFETAGEVYATETQGGEAAVAVHRGPYNRMNEAHDAIRKWMAANRRESAGHSWEIYGDPTPDPADTETTVVYLLK